MTKLNSGSVEKTGRGSDSDRLYQSPQAIRGTAQDYEQFTKGEVQRDSVEADDVPSFTDALDSDI